MQKKNVLFLCFVLFITSYCRKDSNPIFEFESNDGNNQLKIVTNSSVYNWEQGSVEIRGSLTNKSDKVFYSRIGTAYGPSEQTEVYFFHSTEGYLERYDKNEKIWKVQNISSILAGGTGVVPIKPIQEYSFLSHITRESTAEESGKYRFRVDYYSEKYPDSNTVIYSDYSNMFEIN